MRRLRRVLGVLVVGSVVLVGCGGGDGDEETSAPTTVDRSPSATEGSGGSSDGDRGASFTKEGCLQAATAMGEAANGFSSAFSGASEALEDSVGAFEAFAAAAPSEIRADLRAVAEGYAEFVDVLSDSGYNPASGEAPSPETLAKLAAASETLANADFQAAADRVAEWFEEECGA